MTKLTETIARRYSELEQLEFRCPNCKGKVHQTDSFAFMCDGAHSERAFSDATWTAWARIQAIARESLQANGRGSESTAEAKQEASPARKEKAE